MLHAHSYLWHYLWVAPNVLVLVLALFVWKRGLHKRFPAFFLFAVFAAIGHLAAYAADMIPSVTPEIFWRVDWVSLIVDGSLKFMLIGEIFASAFGSYRSLARLGGLLIRAIGISLVLAAAVAAAYAPQDTRFGIIAGAHLLEQTIYLIEAGLLVFIFLFSSYFHLRMSRPLFGIALGLGVSACVHLGTWAVLANTDLTISKRIMLDFLNMVTYHVSVLIWFYYLLGPQRNHTPPGPPSPVAGPQTEEELNVWNEELERLLQR